MSSNPNVAPPDDLETLEEKFEPEKLSNEKLAEIIVAHRYLGVMQSQAIAAMEELAGRRAQGDQFNYEARIEELFSTLPKLNIDLTKIMHSFKLPV